MILAPDHDTVLRTERIAWAKERPLFACKHCPERDGRIDLRHGSEFRDGLMMEDSDGDHWKGLGAKKRYCAECSFHVMKKFWWERKFFFVGGMAWIQCIHCGKIRKGVDVSEEGM